ncbi:hypothetical protein JDN40_14270 [Rhodomicrobium vannielii ATCC 17100]|uniref:hypothetical protein n=1 Tax=Rhodomicrobium vannielii TaxID=1069 RepID=UPI00191B3E69|nr:hypothetical protein [Rhodomicrobium vannielii]MBJ7535273.1 hypothetical protein [Rhodomicrobium vannielii ATCC 17100]
MPYSNEADCRSHLEIVLREKRLTQLEMTMSHHGKRIERLEGDAQLVRDMVWKWTRAALVGAAALTLDHYLNASAVLRVLFGG